MSVYGRLLERRSRKHNIGRTRWKLFEALNKAGFDIQTPENLWMQEGFYRFNYHDLARWGAKWKQIPDPNPNNCGEMNHSICSWDTMGDCVRYGFTVVPDDSLAFNWEIVAKGCSRNKDDWSRNEIQH